MGRHGEEGWGSGRVSEKVSRDWLAECCLSTGLQDVKEHTGVIERRTANCNTLRQGQAKRRGGHCGSELVGRSLRGCGICHCYGSVS